MKILKPAPLFRSAEELLARHFDIVEAHDVLPSPQPGIADAIRGIATNARGKVDRKLIEMLPNLEIVSCFGAATDYVDERATAERKIKVCNTSQALADDVADFAIALAVIGLRGIWKGHRHVASGQWMSGPPGLGKSLGGARLGIVGLGAIGRKIALRGEAFSMEIGYHNRRPADEAPGYRYFTSAADLAQWCDVLVLSCPGGEATRHLVDAEVIGRLGPEGFLVNVARGSVIDHDALVAALARDGIAGIALDVFEQEPAHPVELIEDPRVVLTPHMASATHQARSRMGEMMVSALLSHFRNQSRKGLGE